MGDAMSDITGNAFITTKKGFCYLTIKIGRRKYYATISLMDATISR